MSMCSTAPETQTARSRRPTGGGLRPPPRATGGRLWSGWRVLGAAACGLLVSLAWGLELTYADLLHGVPGTLAAAVVERGPEPGAITINGGDSRGPSVPFTFEWGDGAADAQFFPARHVYADPGRNYLATVTAHYDDQSIGIVQVPVRFVAPALGAHAIPAEVAVSLPPVLPAGFLNTVSGDPWNDLLSPVGERAFVAQLPRAAYERVLGAFAVVQRDLVGHDLHRHDGTFRQLVFESPPEQPYAYSVWFAYPVLFVAHEAYFGAAPDWASFAHELGHNATLNSPASFRLGGRIDGPANAIVSETLAQIFAHVTCHEVVNRAATYGIPDDLAAEIAARARGSFAYLAGWGGPAPFCSWNDPDTEEDETMPTFMVLARQFFVHCAPDGSDYRAATQRLMSRLRLWCPEWEARFDRDHDTPEAARFRATLMVAALSYGVGRDLRAEFRSRGFPLDDAFHAEVVGAAAPPSAREAWRAHHFATVADSGPAADEADPDGDGRVNLLEFATGTDPRSAEAAPVLRASVRVGQVDLVFDRRAEAAALVYRIEQSIDLGTWTEIWCSNEHLYGGGTAPLARETVSVSAGAARCFYRLRVTAWPTPPPDLH